MVNKVILIGNLGRDPEVRRTAGGTSVANFTMATTETYTNKSGEREQQTEWHRIVAWGRLGEFCGEYLHKGKQVYVEGRLQTRDWEDREGVKRRTTEINARTIQMLGRRSDDPDAGGGSSPRSQPSTPPQSELPSDDDIPF